MFAAELIVLKRALFSYFLPLITIDTPSIVISQLLVNFIEQAPTLIKKSP